MRMKSEEAIVRRCRVNQNSVNSFIIHTRTASSVVHVLQQGCQFEANNPLEVISLIELIQPAAVLEVGGIYSPL